MTESQRVHLHSKRACDRMSANSFPLSEKACNRNSSSTGEINFDPPSRHPKRHRHPASLSHSVSTAGSYSSVPRPVPRHYRVRHSRSRLPQCHVKPSAQGRPSTHTECAEQTKSSLRTQGRPSAHTEFAGWTKYLPTSSTQGRPSVHTEYTE